MSERRVADIDVLTITLEIASTRALFVLLARDGTVNRMGSGSPSTADGDLYIGQTQPALLPEALKGLSEEALGHTGVYDIPKKLGVPCRLAIALRFADGSEDGFGYTYGSDSQGPPKPIAMFVHASVMATQSWYQEQRKLVGKVAAPNLLPPQPGRKPWWRVW
jgi:hypothetical protein